MTDRQFLGRLDQAMREHALSLNLAINSRTGEVVALAVPASGGPGWKCSGRTVAEALRQALRTMNLKRKDPDC